jgi:CubicO group peptidase (beta-lactamase class C family)
LRNADHTGDGVQRGVDVQAVHGLRRPLLAQEGKLSLDDDIHKYVPELADFGKKITLRHLLQHTSGLRDYLNLAIMGSWRLDDVLTEDDAFGLIQRQRMLNFAPGDEYLYSNTGYSLLALVVQRVSGKPLAAFAKERIFDPLGMKHTLFAEKYGTLVPGRALSYTPAAPGGYQYVAHSASIAGPSGVITTADDLALWDRNFYEARVGGKELIAAMQVQGALNSGAPIRYASGLFVETYRGQKVVEHSGGLPGFQAQMSRFPEQHFTVAVLANTFDIKPTVLARRIADIYLEKELAAKPAAPPAPAPKASIEIEPARLAPLLGYFALAPNFGLTITADKGRLMAQATRQEKFAMSASSALEFFSESEGLRISFDAPAADGKSGRLVLHQHGKEFPATRGESTAVSAKSFKSYEGEYYSDELHVLYTVAVKGEQLLLTHPRGTSELYLIGDGKFMAGFPLDEVTFECMPNGACNALSASNGRVRNLRFTRVSLGGAGSGISAP